MRQACISDKDNWWPQLASEFDNHAFFSYSIGYLTRLVNAGVLTFKALDSRCNWAALDQGAKDILMLLLHDQPEYRLTAAHLLHDPWLYEAQQKPEKNFWKSLEKFSDWRGEDGLDRERLLLCLIQERGRQCLPVFKDTRGVHVDAHAKQPQHYMARHRGEPQVVQQAEAVQFGLPRMELHPVPFRLSRKGRKGKGSSADFALHDHHYSYKISSGFCLRLLHSSMLDIDHAYMLSFDRHHCSSLRFCHL